MAEPALEVFRRYDINGDGLISSDELAVMLEDLDHETWNKETVDTLLSAADLGKAGGLNFEEFVKWVFAPRLSQRSRAEILPAVADSPAEVFELPLHSLSGDILLTLSDAELHWTRVDILKRVRMSESWPKGTTFKFLFTEKELRGECTLEEIGIGVERILGKMSPLTTVVARNTREQALTEALHKVKLVTFNRRDLLDTLAAPRGLPMWLVSIQAVSAVCNMPCPDWPAAQQLMGRSTWPAPLHDALVDFDADDEPAGTLARLHPYVDNPDFMPSRVRKAGISYEPLATWCHELYRYCLEAEGIE